MRLVFALMTLVVAWPAASASAYESETHRELAARSASPEVSAIDAVLKTDLGLREAEAPASGQATTSVINAKTSLMVTSGARGPARAVPFSLLR